METSDNPSQHFLTSSKGVPRDQRAAMVAEWQAGDESAASFARSRGIAPKLFYRWVAALGETKPAPAWERIASFVPVCGPQEMAAEVQWVLPGNWGTLRGDAQTVAAVLDVLLAERDGGH